MRRTNVTLLLLLAALLQGCVDHPSGPWEQVKPSVPTTVTTLDDSQLAPNNRVTGAWAYLWGWGVGFGPLGALFAFSVYSASVRRRRARAERAFDPRAPVRDGHAVLLGVVEAEDPAQDPQQPFVTLTIEQRGTERNGEGGWHTEWREQNRELVARPFFVRRDDGSRVRVEPGDAPVLHDSLSRVERSEGQPWRKRIAELSPGERVHLVGTLTGALGDGGGAPYREGAPFPTLRAGPRMPLLVSTEAPGSVSAARARFFTRWAVAFGVLLLVAASIEWRFDALVFFGHTVAASPASVSRWQVWVKPKNRSGHWEPHYGVRADGAIAGGAALAMEDECSPGAYAVAQRGETIPFRVASPTVYRIGAGPSLELPELAAIAMPLPFLLIVFLVTSAAKRQWYERKKVVDYVKGRL